MKTTVYRSLDNFWYGKVYADWTFAGECWQAVTKGCYTRIGAIILLKSWLRKNNICNIKIK